MKIVVFGLWHLGTVTAACLANAGYNTVGIDPNPSVIANLRDAIPPLYEPGLTDLVAKGIASGRLSFQTQSAEAIANADIVWVAFDTPVDDSDRADVDYVESQITGLYSSLKDGAVVLISSQLPVGTTRKLERAFEPVANGRMVAFAYSPENLRLGRAIEIFTKPGRIIVGVRDERTHRVLEPLLNAFCPEILWVRTESAEMTKHTLNAFLATCITFINEIATVCERTGADAAEVERSIRTDPRVGQYTYVKPGSAFGGGTLARDVMFLNEVAGRNGLSMPLLGSVIASNDQHRLWALRRLQAHFGSLQGRRISVLGLSYKPGTDAIRRSIAVQLCRSLVEAGARVAAFDPVVRLLPADLGPQLLFADSVAQALDQADAVIVATEWPEFQQISADLVKRKMTHPVVIDQNRFLTHLASDPDVAFLTMGAGA